MVLQGDLSTWRCHVICGGIWQPLFHLPSVGLKSIRHNLYLMTRSTHAWYKFFSGLQYQMWMWKQKSSFNATFWSRTWNLNEWIWMIIYCSKYRIFYKKLSFVKISKKEKSTQTYGCYYCILLENTFKIALCCWKFAAATNHFQDSNELGCINASELSV